MAASSTTGFPISTPAPAQEALPVRSKRRRRIDPASGRALEILGHAIEYLTDELIQQRGIVSANDPQVEAVQILMALNRQVYFACPEVLTFGDRCRSLLRRHSA
jgi:hypothetical protein